MTLELRRARSMPFGAEVRDDGVTRFRLWAPGARSVALWLESRREAVPIPRDAEGWAVLVTADAPPGTRYRFQIDGELLVPDPASRFQPEGVHGPSEVVDPRAHSWFDSDWGGLPPERLVFYELHVGTFTPAGTFIAAAERLNHLAALGITAVQIMPVAEAPGRRGWGYDGVLPFSPKASYGRPEHLKALVDAAHARGIAVFLDVVYNHFGPEGNYLHLYAPPFFNPRHQTPWGAAINFDGAGSEIVRAFVVHNALYWLEEFHLDGLRLDAVHAIHEASRAHVLEELAQAVARGPGSERPVLLVLENDGNEAGLLTPGGGSLHRAQWNDDFHHALHVLLTGDRSGYYADYESPASALGRALAEGFAYQGEHSPYRGRKRGEPSGSLPPTAFVGFLQNHDQVGNRAFGERITRLAPAEAVRAATAVLCLAPSLPLIFMGQEWAAPEPFLFFSDLGPDIGPAVAQGRRREFARFPEFADAGARQSIPDPQADATWARSVLEWSLADAAPHREWLDFHTALLRLRHAEIVPLSADSVVPRTRWLQLGETTIEVEWEFPARGTLRLVANLGRDAVPHGGPRATWGRPLYTLKLEAAGWTSLPPWSVGWYLAEVGQ